MAGPGRRPAQRDGGTRCGRYASSPSPRTVRLSCSPTRSAACSRCRSTSGSPPCCTPSRRRRAAGHDRRGVRTIRRRRCPRATSRRASAPASPPTTWPASPVCRSTGCCATPARCCRSGRCSPSTPGAPACGPPRRAPRWPRWSTAGWASTASTPRRSPGTPTVATTAPGGSSPPGRPARRPRRRSGSSTRPARWSRRTTTWRNTCAPSGPRRCSGQEPAPRSGTRAERARAARAVAGRAVARRPRPAGRLPPPTRRRPGRDPIRAGRDAPARRRSTGRRGSIAGLAAASTPRRVPRSGGAAALLGAVRRVPRSTTTPTRPRRSRPCRRWPCCGRAAPPAPAASEQSGDPSKPRKRLPSWDDVLFGGARAARDLLSR